MGKLIELLTCDDNKTFEPAYFWAAVIIIVGLGMVVYCGIFKDTPFNIQDYGIGTASMLAGLGAAAKWGK